MPSIEIDDQVFQHIKSLAMPWKDKSPNDTLRRHFFGSKKSGQDSLVPSDLNELFERKSKSKVARAKKPKANLAQLIRQNLLTDGQELTLIDYSGNRINGSTAFVSATELRYRGNSYSMSELARRLLNEHGYQSQSVRGPAHWVTSEGKTVKELWDVCLGIASRGAA